MPINLQDYLQHWQYNGVFLYIKNTLNLVPEKFKDRVKSVSYGLFPEKGGFRIFLITGWRRIRCENGPVDFPIRAERTARKI